MTLKHISQGELAQRWGIISWGPDHIKIGCRVIYRLEDVEHPELENTRSSTRFGLIG